MDQEKQTPRPIFREVQHVDQIWIWALMIGLAALSWVMAWKHHIIRHPFSHHSVGEMALFVLWPLFGIVLPIVVPTLRMITVVRKDGIYVRALPFQRSIKKIAFQDFKRYEMLVYRKIGFGIRYGRKGQAYNLSGDRGIELTFHDGSQLMIGSGRVREFLQAIHSQCAGPRAPGTLGGRRDN